MWPFGIIKTYVPFKNKIKNPEVTAMGQPAKRYFSLSGSECRKLALKMKRAAFFLGIRSTLDMNDFVSYMIEFPSLKKELQSRGMI